MSHRPVQRTDHTAMKHRGTQWFVVAGLIIWSGCVHASRPVAERAKAPDKNFHIYLCFGQSNMEGFPPVSRPK
jgi:hypothetical protein